MSVKRTSKTVFATPWFEVVAKSSAADDRSPPHYALRLDDYVCAVAVTPTHEFILVRQDRPAVDRRTLELPAGHVDPGESPEESARRELEEETGFTAPRWEALGGLAPDTGRLSNRLWCFLALDARPRTPPAPAEAGIEVELCTPAGLLQKIRNLEFDHALHLAALHLAWVSGKLPAAAGGLPPF